MLALLFKRENAIVLLALCLLIALAWLSLLTGAGTGMDPRMMSGWWLPLSAPASPMSGWSPAYWLIAFFMWVVMMVAMMLPSASPAVLLHAQVLRRSKPDAPGQRAATAAFAAGYIALWVLFSAAAVLLHFALERAGLLSGTMSSRSALLSGGLLVAAGLYQLTPLKDACLRHCRGPAHFLTQHWRPGLLGAFRMGLAHGAYCLGCCAVLMLLLFVGGVMNLVWIAGLTLFVAVEKLAPHGAAISRLTAILLIAAGLALIGANLAAAFS
ncbi:DUF2182 domain-containing protein [Methyloligella sp. GL2]|nr:DUF2182 domain-containing protein [Methyloligella sp. GL2]